MTVRRFRNDTEDSVLFMGDPVVEVAPGQTVEVDLPKGQACPSSLVEVGAKHGRPAKETEPTAPPQAEEPPAPTAAGADDKE